MKCPSCGTLNQDAALSCALCGWVITREAPAEGSVVDQPRNEDAPRASAHLIQLEAAGLRARMFLILMLAQVLLLGMIGAGLFFLLNEDLSGMKASPATTLGLVACLVLMLNFAVAFLIAKTGTLMGMPFWINFLMSFVLPAIPGVWARIGGRSLIYVYGLIAADLFILTSLWNTLGPGSITMQVIMVVMVPVFIYHATGCAAPTVSHTLGLNPYLTVMWICIAPLGILLAWIYQVYVPEGWFNRIDALGHGSESALALMIDMAPSFYGSSTVLGAFLVYVGSVFAIWIHSLHLNLKYPVI